MNDTQPPPHDKGGVISLDRRSPRVTARLLLDELFTYAPEKRHTLLFADDDFYVWTNPIWKKMPAAAMRKIIYDWLELQVVDVTLGDAVIQKPFDPIPNDIYYVKDSLASLLYVDAKAPAWLGAAPNDPDVRDIIVTENAILRLGEDGVETMRPTPRLFSTNAVPFRYDPDAPEPTAWLNFLHDIWEDDTDTIDLLQSWFGYCLTQDTRQQKMLLVCGPPRSGKGTIARVLRRLLGDANVTGPTLSGLSTEFGLWDMIGKTLAIVSDARLTGRTDQATVVERLLSISGEDYLTINRKQQSLVNEQLKTRIMILTNELPRLGDSSGALAKRFLHLPMTKTFYGEEDQDLTTKLFAEQAGILNWSLTGLYSLRSTGFFVPSKAGQDAAEQLESLSSPIHQFAREWCSTIPAATCDCKVLYDCWRAWCELNGREQPGDTSRFGRDLHAAYPHVKKRQTRTGSTRGTCYEGIGLSKDGQAAYDETRFPRYATESEAA